MRRLMVILILVAVGLVPALTTVSAQDDDRGRDRQSPTRETPVANDDDGTGGDPGAGAATAADQPIFPEQVEPPTCGGRPATIWNDTDGTIVGTGNADVIVGSFGPDFIAGRGGDDYICSLAGNDEIYGEGGNDQVWSAGGNDVVAGSVGADTLRGGADNDKLFGWSGNDRIFGGSGDDEMRGEQNIDLCDGGSGTDTVVNPGSGGCETVRNVP
jgi:Ca2+-binding RTX toxin-like protein